MENKRPRGICYQHRVLTVHSVHIDKYGNQKYNVNMKTIRISATEARNDFFTLLNKVIFGETTVIINKAGADREAVLSVATTDADALNERITLLDESFGVYKNKPISKLTDIRLRGAKGKIFLEQLRNE